MPFIGELKVSSFRKYKVKFTPSIKDLSNLCIFCIAKSENINCIDKEFKQIILNYLSHCSKKNEKKM